MNLDSQRVPRYFQRGMVECVGGNSRTNKRDPITIEKLTRRFANRFDSIRVTAKGSKGIVYIDIDIDIYIGSRRPEVAGQLISHFFDEDSRNSRCSLCRDTSSNNFFELQPPREPTVENRTSKKGNEVESNKTGVQVDLLVRRTPSSFPSKFCQKRDQISFIIYARYIIFQRNNE